MRRILLSAVPLLLLAAPASAAEWVLVRWVGPQRCEVLSYRPPFGNWEELAAFRGRKEADRALDAAVRLKKCRAPAKPAPVETKPQTKPQPPIAR